MIFSTIRQAKKFKNHQRTFRNYWVDLKGLKKNIHLVEQASCRTRVGGAGVTSLSPENPIIVLYYLMTTSSIFHSWLFASCFYPLKWKIKQKYFWRDCLRMDFVTERPHLCHNLCMCFSVVFTPPRPAESVNSFYSDCPSPERITR